MGGNGNGNSLNLFCWEFVKNRLCLTLSLAPLVNLFNALFPSSALVSGKTNKARGDNRGSPWGAHTIGLLLNTASQPQQPHCVGSPGTVLVPPSLPIPPTHAHYWVRSCTSCGKKSTPIHYWAQGCLASISVIPDTITVSVSIKLSLFVLTYNCFRFGDPLYLQTNGAAMGTYMAP